MTLSMFQKFCASLNHTLSLFYHFTVNLSSWSIFFDRWAPQQSKLEEVRDLRAVLRCHRPSPFLIRFVHSSPSQCDRLDLHCCRLDSFLLVSQFLLIDRVVIARVQIWHSSSALGDHFYLSRVSNSCLFIVYLRTGWFIRLISVVLIEIGIGEWISACRWKFRWRRRCYLVERGIGAGGAPARDG